MNDSPLAVEVDPSGIILYKIQGALTEDRRQAFMESVEKAERIITEQFSRTGKKVRILLDGTGFNDVYDVSMMEAFAAFAEKMGKYIEKTAGFGGSIKMRAAADIVIALAHRDNVKFFRSEEEAVNWLQE